MCKLRELVGVYKFDTINLRPKQLLQISYCGRNTPQGWMQVADIVHRSACLPVIREMGLPEARFLAPTHPIHPPTNTHIKPARYYSDHSGLGFGSFQAKHPLRLTLGHGVSCLVFSIFFCPSFYSSTIHYYTITYIVYHTYCMFVFSSTNNHLLLHPCGLMLHFLLLSIASQNPVLTTGIHTPSQ